MRFNQEEEELEISYPPPPPPPLVQSDDDDVDEYEKEEEEEEEEEEEKEVNESAEEKLSSTFVPTKDSTPYLVYHHGKKNCKQTFFSMLEENYSVTSIPEMCGMSCAASSHGWLVMLDNYSDQCFLLNPVSMEKIQLPPIKINSPYRYNECVLTSSPPDCVVMFVSDELVNCIFCKPNDKKWIRKPLGPKQFRIGSRNCFQYIESVVSCKGKIYIAFKFGSGIKVLDFKTDHHNPTTLKIKIEDGKAPCHRWQNFTKGAISTYLVESCGEVYIVIKLCWGGSGRNRDVYNIEVYKLNSSSSCNCDDTTTTTTTTTWEKVESLGEDRLFFLGGGSSLSFSASKIGTKENCIFFYESEDECLYSYNMDDQSISIDLPCPHIVSPANEPYWMLPIV